MVILQDFECTGGHITEQSVESGTTAGRCGMRGCRKKANVVYLPPRISRAARNFESALYFEKPDGELFVPGRSDIRHLPKKLVNKLQREGYTPKTITNMSDYIQLKRRQNVRSREQEQLHDLLERNLYEAELREGVAALTRGFDMVREDGSVVHVQADQFSGKGQEFLAEAMKHTDYSPSSKGGDFFIQALEYDSCKWKDRG